MLGWFRPVQQPPAKYGLPDFEMQWLRWTKARDDEYRALRDLIDFKLELTVLPNW